MGNSPSQLNEAGFRIVKLYPNGPAARAGLQPFFDFVISVQGKPVESGKPLTDLLEEAESPVTISVYNSRRGSAKDLYLSRQAWQARFHLGATVRFEPFSNARHEGLKVVEVEPNSASATAGIVANRDWILGSVEGTMFGSHYDLISYVRGAIDMDSFDSGGESSGGERVSPPHKATKTKSPGGPSRNVLVGFLVFDSQSGNVRECFLSVSTQNPKIGSTVIKSNIPLAYEMTDDEGDNNNGNNNRVDTVAANLDGVAHHHEVSLNEDTTSHSEKSSTNGGETEGSNTGGGSSNSVICPIADDALGLTDFVKHLTSVPPMWSPLIPAKSVPMSQWLTPKYLWPAESLFIQDDMATRMASRNNHQDLRIGTIVSSSVLGQMMYSQQPQTTTATS